MITKFARLEFELFTKPSHSDFLRDHQNWIHYAFKWYEVLKQLNMDNILAEKSGISGTHKILIVDHDISFLNSVENFLKVYAENIVTRTAGNGKQAWQILSSSSVDLIVTNLNLPDIDGIEFLIHIKRNQPDISIIVLTEQNKAEDQKNLSKIGYFHYLDKSAKLEILAEKILNVLKESSKTSVHGFTLVNFLQLVEMEEKTATVIVRSKGRIGFLYFKNGELINAESHGLIGETAAVRIISWQNSSTEIQAVCNKDRIINTPLMRILLQAARIEDEKDSSPTPEDLMEEAVNLAKGLYFKEAQKIITSLLKMNPRNIQGWLWYSRVSENKKSISIALNNAIKMAPGNKKILSEIVKFNLVKNKIGDEWIQRCPFCWTPLEHGVIQCPYCKSYLMISENIFYSIQSTEHDILEKAVDRYTKAIDRDKNINAHYYLSLAYLNLKNWEEALNQLDKTVKLTPKEPYYSDQLRILLKYMASRGAPATQEKYLKEKSDNSKRLTDGFERKKILVVEDSSTTRKVITITLGQKGYEIIEAKDGLEALSKFNEMKPDLVLLDIILPKMDGFQILSIIKNNPDFKNIPVVMLTSKDGLLNKVKGKVAGSAAYLTKPFDPKQLVKTVEKYL